MSARTKIANARSALTALRWMNPTLVTLTLAALTAMACGSPAPEPPKTAPPSAASAATPSATPVVVAADPETPDAPYRATRPPSGPTPAFTLPKIDVLALPNGVPVYLVERHDLPVLEVDLSFAGGQSDLAHDDFWAARILTEVVQKGAGSRDAIALSDRLAALGSTLDVRVWADSARVTMKLTAASANDALPIMGDVVLRPTLSEAELERVRARWKASQANQKTDRDLIGSTLMDLSLYGASHPYGHAYLAEPRELDALSVAALRRVRAHLFARERAALIVVGDTTKEAMLPILEKSFGDWKPAGIAAKVSVPAPPKQDPAARIVLSDLPGASQSLVLLAEPAIPYASPDRYAFRVMNAILGGFWMSRLNANLREEKGYSYWVNSGVSARRVAGPFRAGGAMQAAKTGASITEIEKEMSALRDHEVSPEELRGAKTFLINQLRGGFDRTDATADLLATLITFGLPMSELETQAAAIEALTAADVKRVAMTYLHPATMRILVVGDRAKVTPQLEALGVGPIDLRDAYGKKLAEKKSP